jgi:hypothetical protein
MKRTPKVLRLAETLAAGAERLVGRLRFEESATREVQVGLAAAIRSVGQYRSIVELLKVGAWEDAQVLLRSMIGLLVNLLELFESSTADELESRCGRFCKFALLDAQLSRRRDGRYARARAQRERINAELLKHFPEFAIRNDKGEPRLRQDGWVQFWDTWSGKRDAQLLDLPEKLDGGRTPHRYLYAVSSAYVHAGPLALFAPLCLAAPTQSNDWPSYAVNRSQMGRELTPLIALAAAEFLVDTLENVARSIELYDSNWRISVPRRLLDSMVECLPPGEDRGPSGQPEEATD